MASPASTHGFSDTTQPREQPHARNLGSSETLGELLGHSNPRDDPLPWFRCRLLF
jgi:hypothetical protein